MGRSEETMAPDQIFNKTTTRRKPYCYKNTNTNQSSYMILKTQWPNTHLLICPFDSNLPIPHQYTHPQCLWIISDTWATPNVPGRSLMVHIPSLPTQTSGRSRFFRKPTTLGCSSTMNQYTPLFLLPTSKDISKRRTRRFLHHIVPYILVIIRLQATPRTYWHCTQPNSLLALERDFL